MVKLVGKEIFLNPWEHFTGTSWAQLTTAAFLLIVSFSGWPYEGLLSLMVKYPLVGWND